VIVPDSCQVSGQIDLGTPSPIINDKVCMCVSM